MTCRRCGAPATHAIVPDTRAPAAAQFCCAEHVPIRGIAREPFQLIDLRVSPPPNGEATS